MKNRTVMGIICIVAALVFAFGAVPLINAVSEGKTTSTVAVKDIEKGQIINPEDVETKTVHSSDLPANHVQNPEKVIGKYADCDIKSGCIIQTSMYTTDGNDTDGALSTLDGTKQAISVTLDSLAAGISGKLKNGDIVSAIVSDGSCAIIPKELKYIKVITATYRDGKDITEADTDDENHTSPATATLLVNSVQARMLANYEHSGYIHLALVYRGDKETADRFISAQDSEFAGGAAQ